MMILYFEDGIKDPTLDAARNAILVNLLQLQDFDSIMHMYLTSKCSQKSEAAVLQGRQLSAITGRGGGRGGGGAGRGGRGRGDPKARQRELVSQAKTDKVTTVENKYYPKELYAKFSATKKAKHWQLRNLGKELSASPTSGRKTEISAANVSDFASASAVSAISVLSDMTKRTSEEGTDDDPTRPICETSVKVMDTVNCELYRFTVN